MSPTPGTCWHCKTPLSTGTRCPSCGRQQLVVGQLKPKTPAPPVNKSEALEEVDNKEERDSNEEKSGDTQAFIHEAATSLVNLVEQINEFEAYEAVSKKKIKDLESKAKMPMPKVLQNAAFLMTPDCKPVSHCTLQSPTLKSFSGALGSVKPPCFGVTKAYEEATASAKKSKPPMPSFLAPPKVAPKEDAKEAPKKDPEEATKEAPKEAPKETKMLLAPPKAKPRRKLSSGHARIKTLEKENKRLRQTVQTLRADKDILESRFDELEAKFEALCNAIRAKQEAENTIDDILEDEFKNASGMRSNPLSPSPSYCVPSGDRLE